ncbi:hypothetical protein EON64_10745, partial [archaeon]
MCCLVVRKTPSMQASASPCEFVSLKTIPSVSHSFLLFLLANPPILTSISIPYPFSIPDSPEVTFLPPVPVHSHIYSNGHICLNILGDDWSPALTVRSICLSLLSMLSSATVKCTPPDNAIYSRSNRST